MSKPDDGGAAFPRDNGYVEWGGMTLRDYFAAAALQGLIQRGWNPYAVSDDAYKVADAMIAERGRVRP